MAVRRKSIKAAAGEGANSMFHRSIDGRAYDALHVQDTQDVQGVKDAHDTQKTEYTRLNLRVPKDVRDWLYEAAYNESTPTRHVSATAYLVELVRADRDRHKGE